ncbi:phosphate ABC transporter permease subunit PstC [Methanobrevibacter sp.]|uniref:phosphate ABC transporter permease subunit PstC n=1 Tax=Methanobrevibacter sp. TaxID=66852 RepID=UPI0026E09DD7|nr:phosphate ABC transporter permease subunit PstC [Methanobrevibacter sp.]MDO5859951.1 phosphate ABC transporter permease subunit PstC [Methanobrevibacter sp.]
MNIKEYLIEKSLSIIVLFLVILVFLLIVFMLIEAIPAFYDVGFLNFVLGSNWIPDNGEFGILPMILGSLYITSIALLISIPLSISCAIFLEEIAPNTLKNIFKPVIQMLAGIPSVIYGFFGLTLIVPIIRNNLGGNGFSILAAAIVLSFMILPTITSLTQDAIKSVPNYYKEASFGLGSTQWQCIKRVILPIAMPGIGTAVILGMGRAIGETLAVLMLAGNISNIPTSVIDPIRTLTSNIALEMGYATGIHYNALFATAVILFVVIVFLMIVSVYIQNRYAVKEVI